MISVRACQQLMSVHLLVPPKVVHFIHHLQLKISSQVSSHQGIVNQDVRNKDVSSYVKILVTSSNSDFSTLD